MQQKEDCQLTEGDLTQCFVYDESIVSHTDAFEALDATLHNCQLMGGETVLLLGDLTDAARHTKMYSRR